MTYMEVKVETDRVFSEMYSIADILKGNSVDMLAEARRIAVLNLKGK